MRASMASAIFEIEWMNAAPEDWDWQLLDAWIIPLTTPTPSRLSDHGQRSRVPRALTLHARPTHPRPAIFLKLSRTVRLTC